MFSHFQASRCSKGALRTAIIFDAMCGINGRAIARGLKQWKAEEREFADWSAWEATHFHLGSLLRPLRCQAASLRRLVLGLTYSDMRSAESIALRRVSGLGRAEIHTKKSRREAPLRAPRSALATPRPSALFFPLGLLFLFTAIRTLGYDHQHFFFFLFRFSLLCACVGVCLANERVSSIYERRRVPLECLLMTCAFGRSPRGVGRRSSNDLSSHPNFASPLPSFLVLQSSAIG